MIVNATRDTMFVSNAAFVVVAALAGLCFSMASSLDVLVEPVTKHELVESGQCLFVSSSLLMTCAIIKYTWFYRTRFPWWTTLFDPDSRKLVEAILLVCVVICFILGAMFGIA